MELLQLRYFCDAAQTENFSQTARKFQVPTSNISQTVKRLEAELGSELFLRRKNRVALSEQGRIFYQGARVALEKLEETRMQLRDLQSGVSGEVRILSLTNRRIITQTVERFKTDHPAVSFIISHNHTAQADGFDVIIADEYFYAQNYSRTVLLTEDILLAVTKGHPLADAAQLQLSDLRGERFISMPGGSSLYAVTNRICRQAGFVPEITIETDDPYYVRKYVELGLGVALVPERSWKGMLSEGLVLKQLGVAQRSTCLFLPEERYLSKPARLFAQLLIQTAESY